MQFTVAQDIASLQSALSALAKEGKRTSLVPTMGALHEGHISLIKAAGKMADAVVVSIFVNPTQFGPNEDFAKYPRMLEADIQKAREAGATLIYTPSVEDMYPNGFTTTVSPGALGQILDGVFRPGHFEGVCTVVSKLLLRILPQVALFGEKDYQQFCIIARMVYDLDIPIGIMALPTVREADGLAMSSRNAYLSADERKKAAQLYATLKDAAKKIEDGADVTDTTDAAAKSLTAAGFKVDYVELRQSITLAAMPNYVAPARLLAAAWLGKTRLIDNIAIGEK